MLQRRETGSHSARRGARAGAGRPGFLAGPEPPGKASRNRCAAWEFSSRDRLGQDRAGLRPPRKPGSRRTEGAAQDCIRSDKWI